MVARGRRDLAAWGYNLVALAVFITVLNIMVAAMLPSLTRAVDREKEEELIFRGLQYAEAIRVFQKRTGRFPTRLDELLEVEPRSIRQLWTDPFRDDGKWAVVVAQTPQRAQRGRDLQGRANNNRRRGRRGEEQRNTREEDSTQPTQDVGPDRNRASSLSRQGAQTSGPITGVRSLEDHEAAKTFMGSNQVSEWVFSVQSIPVLPAGAVADVMPRLNSNWIGRPFPDGIELPQGSAPEDTLGPEADTRTERSERQNNNRRRNNRRSRDGRR